MIIMLLSLSRDAKAQDVIDRIDDILRDYGGSGAYVRDDQLSHRFLSEEIDELEKLSGIFPIIFLSVAAFLLNVVVSRLVGHATRTDRSAGRHLATVIWRSRYIS